MYNELISKLTTTVEKSEIFKRDKGYKWLD